MKAQPGDGGRAARQSPHPTPSQATPPKSPSAGADGDGQVVPVGDDFSDFADPTERSLVDVEAVEGEAGAKAAGSKPRVADENLARERRPTVVSSIPAQLARSMMGDARPTAGAGAGAGARAGAPAPMHQEVTR